MEIINIKCGEIYLGKNYSYIFHCIHCDKKFTSLEYFKKHNFNHFKQINNASVQIKVEVEEELCNEEESDFKQTNLSNEEFEDLEVLDTNVDDYFTKIDISDSKDPDSLEISYSPSEEKFQYMTIDLELANEEINSYEICGSEHSTISGIFSNHLLDHEVDDNCSLDDYKTIKIELENEESSEGKTNELEPKIVDSSHCKRSYSPVEKHDFEQCEMMQQKISVNQENISASKRYRKYMCDYCPRYFESNKSLLKHSVKHLNKNKRKRRILESELNQDEFNIKQNTEENSDSERISLSESLRSEKYDGIKEMKISPNQNGKNSKDNDQKKKQRKKKVIQRKCRHCGIVFKQLQNHNVRKCSQIQQIKNTSENCFEVLEKDGIHLCRECPRYFEDETELILHRRKHYNNGECPICKRLFENLEIIDHVKVEHPETIVKELLKDNVNNKKPFQCKYCGRKFVSEVYWSRHLLVHRNNGLQCEFCNKICQSAMVLRNHIRTHTGERPFICKLCPAAFSLKHNLDLHFIYKHTEEKPFECQYDGGCGKSFKTVQLRNYHERRHTGEILKKCDICGIEYRNKSAFRKHMKVRHMSYDERPHQCEYCDKKFVEMGRLKEHIRTHTGEKPLQCEVCLKKFARYTVLREHKKLHSGIKNHVCSICGKAFAQTSGYFNHVNKEHKEM